MSGCEGCLVALSTVVVKESCLGSPTRFYLDALHHDDGVDWRALLKLPGKPRRTTTPVSPESSSLEYESMRMRPSIQGLYILPRSVSDPPAPYAAYGVRLRRECPIEVAEIGVGVGVVVVVDFGFWCLVEAGGDAGSGGGGGGGGVAAGADKTGRELSGVGGTRRGGENKTATRRCRDALWMARNKSIQAIVENGAREARRESGTADERCPGARVVARTRPQRALSKVARRTARTQSRNRAVVDRMLVGQREQDCYETLATGGARRPGEDKTGASSIECSKDSRGQGCNETLSRGMLEGRREP
ncbi:hypothetical protein F4818DRAFT_442149 [Hypoxylon cercidicola]|nr:hypothetical protein F4818DRAFT_442149 [Hypoxylon cercidicola]